MSSESSKVLKNDVLEVVLKVSYNENMDYRQVSVKEVIKKVSKKSSKSDILEVVFQTLKVWSQHIEGRR